MPVENVGSNAQSIFDLRLLPRIAGRKVYAFLGKLELALKYSENAMSAYHGDAKEGAREARALLASAAADPLTRRGWAVPRVPKIREMVGGREGCVSYVIEKVIENIVLGLQVQSTSMPRKQR